MTTDEEFSRSVLKGVLAGMIPVGITIVHSFINMLITMTVMKLNAINEIDLQKFFISYRFLSMVGLLVICFVIGMLIARAAEYNIKTWAIGLIFPLIIAGLILINQIAIFRVVSGNFVIYISILVSTIYPLLMYFLIILGYKIKRPQITEE